MLDTNNNIITSSTVIQGKPVDTFAVDGVIWYRMSDMQKVLSKVTLRLVVYKKDSFDIQVKRADTGGVLITSLRHKTINHILCIEKWQYENMLLPLERWIK